MIVAKGVGKSFGGERILSGVDLTFHEGEVVGIVVAFFVENVRVQHNQIVFH